MTARTFTFLHAADLHLDSPLRGLARYPGAPVERLRNATRAAFVNLVEAALAHRVAFVIVAGDVFDGDWRDYNSGLWFTSEARRLVEAGIALVLLRGNHDAESRLTKGLRHGPGVYEFPTDAAVTHTLEGFDVALHGQSFAVPHVTENLVRAYPAPLPGAFNIGVLHTGLEGYEGHGRYAPCTPLDLQAKGYDYWALGHIHQRQVVSQDPWIVFPGNLQGRHARELGPKGATLVRVVEGQVSAVEALECDVARWAHIEQDLTGIETEAAAFVALERALSLALRSADGRLVAARVTFRGTTLLDGALRADPRRVEGEVRNLGLSVSAELWVEKVLIETEGVAQVEAQAQRSGDAFAALAQRLSGAGLDDEELTALAADLGRLGDRLPPNVAAALQPKDPAVLRAAVEPAARYLAALLRHQEAPHGGSSA
ncbi:MAG: metallophosphoesterase [Planctomycetota bacterium]